jgi:hypothetical protein
VVSTLPDEGFPLRYTHIRIVGKPALAPGAAQLVEQLMGRPKGDL